MTETTRGGGGVLTHDAFADLALELRERRRMGRDVTRRAAQQRAREAAAAGGDASPVMRRLFEMCHPDCLAWLVDDDRVVACDECGYFASDDEAAVYVARELIREGLVSVAPCGSATCEDCFAAINCGAYVGTDPAHAVLFEVCDLGVEVR